MDQNFTTDWFSHHIPRWEELLSGYKGKPDLRFLEIGSWEGRSACWLLKNILTHETSTLTCIDPFIGNRSIQISRPASVTQAETLFDANIRAIGGSLRVIKIKSPSREALCMLPAEHYDFVYIDGSHDATDVLTDAVLGWRTLKPGGLIVFDDYEWNRFEDPLLTPKVAINSFLSIFKQEVDDVHIGLQATARKRAQADQNMTTSSGISQTLHAHIPA